MRKNIVAVCAVVAMALAVMTIPAKSQQMLSRVRRPRRNASCPVARRSRQIIRARE